VEELHVEALQPYPGAPERILLAADGIYRWRGRSVGRTIINAHRGAVLLTNHRFVFLSKGRANLWWAVAWGSLGLAPEAVANAATVTDAGVVVLRGLSKLFGPSDSTEKATIEPSRLLADGSLSVPLRQLDEFGVVIKRWSNYLWIAYGDADGVRREYAFNNQVLIPEALQWEDEIRLARAALGAAG
jgi:hypothetical protein